MTAISAMTTPDQLTHQLQTLRESGAAQRDPVGWHYIEVLNRRTQGCTGKAQMLLQHKLQQLLDDFRSRQAPASGQALSGALPSSARAPTPVDHSTAPSALSCLLQDMQGAGTAPPATRPGQRSGSTLPPENPRVRQLRQQLRKISVTKQVQQAIAQAPQNAGPINSQKLVSRALGLMREISPDYLERFMTHVDTLLCLERAGPLQATTLRKKPLRG